MGATFHHSFTLLLLVLLSKSSQAGKVLARSSNDASGSRLNPNVSGLNRQNGAPLLLGCAAGQKTYCASMPRFTYPLTVADLDAELIVRGLGWGEVGLRLALDDPSPPIRVVILGGSMTCGGDVAKKDSWPAVLAEHFKRAYHGRVVIVNRCAPATGMTWAVHKISSLIEERDDIVIVDYVQNDGRPTMNDVQDGGHDVDSRTQIALEAFLFTLGKLRKQPPLVLFYCTIPPPQFFSRHKSEWANFWSRGLDAPSVQTYLQVLHRHKTNYEIVARRYGVSVAALQQALWPHTNDTTKVTAYWLSDLPGNDWNHHPGRDIHHLVADSVFHVWQKLVSSMDTAPRPSFRNNSVQPLASPEMLNSWRVCEYMTSSLSAEIECATGSGTALQRAWPCLRDVATKPLGWIFDPSNRTLVLPHRSLSFSQQRSLIRAGTRHGPSRRKRPSAGTHAKRRRSHKDPASTHTSSNQQLPELTMPVLSFLLPCSRNGIVGLEYLKSYEGMGTVEVTVEKHDNIKVSKKSSMLFKNEADTRNIIETRPTGSARFIINSSWPQHESLSHVETLTYNPSCFVKGDTQSPIAIKFKPVINDGTALPGKFKLMSIFTC